MIVLTHERERSLILTLVNLDEGECHDYWPLSHGERRFYLPGEYGRDWGHAAFGAYSGWSHRRAELNPVFWFCSGKAQYVFDRELRISRGTGDANENPRRTLP